MLRLVKHFESTSSVSSLDVNDLFSADFDVYCLQINSLDFGSSLNTTIKLQYLDSSGSVATDYSYGTRLLRSDTGFGDSNTTSSTYFAGQITDKYQSCGEYWFFNPYQSKPTVCIMHTSAIVSSTSLLARVGGSLKDSTTSYTGLRLEPNSSGTLEHINFNLYGLRGH